MELKFVEREKRKGMRPVETNEELIELCREWRSDVSKFTQIVSDGLRILEISESDFAKELRTAPVVVSRWANGFAYPTFSAQKNIVALIRKRAMGHGVLGTIGKEMMREWLRDGRDRGATHMLVVYDADTKEVYHPYVMPQENVSERMKLYDAEAKHCTIAVYSLSQDIDRQLEEKRPWHISA